jgi:hypothetical protein
LYDPHRKWAPRGICRWEDRHLFFSAGGQPNRPPAKSTQARWDQAKEICGMCPVSAECRRDTLGEEYGVYGGLDEHQRYLIRRKLRKAIHNWPEGRRLAWAKEIWTLRQAEMLWSQIATRTGIPAGAAEELAQIWAEHLAKVIEGQPLAKVVDLELPEPQAQRLPPFPDRPGRRNCWVRHRGIVSDGWYRGETPDGQWVQVTTFAGRGQVNKWFEREDVHFYHPVGAVILNYKARPDGLEALDATA